MPPLAHTAAPAARRRPLRALVALAVLAAPLAACSDNDDTSTGSFEVELSSDPTRTFGGDALALVDGEFGFALLLESDADVGPNQLSIFLIRDDATIPGTGTYTITTMDEVTGTDFWGPVETAIGEPEEKSCTTRAGTLTITSASSRRIVGSLDFTMGCPAPDPEVPEEVVTVTGTFEAVVVGAG